MHCIQLVSTSLIRMVSPSPLFPLVLKVRESIARESDARRGDSLTPPCTWPVASASQAHRQQPALRRINGDFDCSVGIVELDRNSASSSLIASCCSLSLSISLFCHFHSRLMVGASVWLAHQAPYPCISPFPVPCFIQ
jgi:hypothetical protein